MGGASAAAVVAEDRLLVLLVGEDDVGRRGVQPRRWRGCRGWHGWGLRLLWPCRWRCVRLAVDARLPRRPGHLPARVVHLHGRLVGRILRGRVEGHGEVGPAPELLELGGLDGLPERGLLVLRLVDGGPFSPSPSPSSSSSGSSAGT